VINRFIIILAPFLFFSSCKKDDKPEYADEKAPVTVENKQEPGDSVKPLTTDTLKKNSEEEKFRYQRSETPVAVISPLDASEYMGKYVTVKGFIADVYQSDKVAYLNFVKKYPDNPFTGVVFARMFDSFGDLQVYAGKDVEISGRISTFRGKPQMILDKPSQIKLVN
jgi:hypothetical protein